MKKILVMFLSIVLCFGLAACGSEGDGGDKKKTSMESMKQQIMTVSK